MTLSQLDTRKAQIAVGAGFLALSAVLALESARLGPGWGDAGPEAGFYPMLLSLVLLFGAAGTVWEGVRARDVRPLFAGREEVVELARVGLPLLAATVSIPLLGFYLMTALYVGLFSWWYGRFRWYLVIPGGIALAALLFLAFEIGFRVFLPKSLLYGVLLPF